MQFTLVVYSNNGLALRCLGFMTT